MPGSPIQTKQPDNLRTVLRRRIGLLAALGLLSVVSACNDPYSQARIKQRWAHFDSTATDIVDREKEGVIRVDEADQTVRKWWKSRCEVFERRLPTVGDYVW